MKMLIFHPFFNCIYCIYILHLCILVEMKDNISNNGYAYDNIFLVFSKVNK